MTPRFRELRDNLISKKYPYKGRITLKGSSNLKMFTSRALSQLGISSSVLGDDLIKNSKVQLDIINLLISFSRITTNVLVKAAYAHTLFSDNEFWSALSLDFSSADITEDEFKEWFSALILRLSLGWGYGKLDTAAALFIENIEGALPASVITRHLHEHLLNDVKWLISEAATDTTLDLSTYINSPLLSTTKGDGYLDNDYQDVIDREIKHYLQIHGIGFSAKDIERLSINLFRPNNDPLNPHSTINAEKRFAELQTTTTTRSTSSATEKVVASTSIDAKNANTVPLYKNTGWFLEWAPAQSFGVATVPIEVAYPTKLPMQNVLSIKDAAATARLDTYLTAVNFLPLSAAHMVTLQNFQTTRRTIAATNVTLASKYIQVLTENFPQFSLEISAVRFGNIHERVLNFLEALITFVNNPRKYPGSVFMYNAFMNEMPVFQSAIPYRAKIFKRYEIIPMVYSKRADAQNNTLIKITVSGLIVGSNETY